MQSISMDGGGDGDGCGKGRRGRHGWKRKRGWVKEEVGNENVQQKEEV